MWTIEIMENRWNTNSIYFLISQCVIQLSTCMSVCQVWIINIHPAAHTENNCTWSHDVLVSSIDCLILVPHFDTLSDKSEVEDERELVYTETLLFWCAWLFRASLLPSKQMYLCYFCHWMLCLDKIKQTFITITQLPDIIYITFDGIFQLKVLVIVLIYSFVFTGFRTLLETSPNTLYYAEIAFRTFKIDY